MNGDLLKPSDAARRLDLAPNTLRVYSTRFAALLSSDAAVPRTSRSGGPGHRLYSSEDLAVLMRAKSLLVTGLTYDEVLARMRAESDPQPSPRRTRALAGEREGATDLRALQEALEAWRSLAEERSREIVQLRQRVRELETIVEEEWSRRQSLPGEDRRTDVAEQEPAHQQRPVAGWWARLFSASHEMAGGSGD